MNTTTEPYVNSRGVEYRPRLPVVFSGEERPNGDPLLGTRAQWEKRGVAEALDLAGASYVCGYDATRNFNPDGSGTLTETWHGKRRTWVRDAAPNGHGTWIEDTTAAAVAHANLQTPDNLRGAAWTLPSGKKWDTKDGRDAVLETCRRWVAQYRKGDGFSLWLHGGPGRGKSQLATWLLGDLAQGGIMADRWSVPEVIGRMRRGYDDDPKSVLERKAHEAAVERAKIVPVLVLEDPSADRQAEDVRKLLYDVLEARVSARLPFIATDNNTPDGIERLGWDPRVASRCRTALCLELKGRDFRPQAEMHGRWGKD